ncbi:Bbp19 family protein [Bordetella genomosp. 1]|uniref:Endopeptidase n=1 Tax=Bordetella genomosp. 1 TaxID=1395607 RepID=A0ABX4EW59_9BORD|nr:endopeptidase [Bordetella genomosp. 1]OZI58715.1 endopeptidase [Bordetella genomosp. 1]
MSQPAYDPHNPSAVEHGRQARRDKQRQELLIESDDLKWLMANRRGRRIVWRLLEQAGVFRSVFSTNAMEMAFKEGNRNGGLQLMSLVLGTCPERYAEMLTEHRTNDDRKPSDDR